MNQASLKRERGGEYVKNGSFCKKDFKSHRCSVSLPGRSAIICGTVVLQKTRSVLQRCHGVDSQVVGQYPTLWVSIPDQPADPSRTPPLMSGLVSPFLIWVVPSGLTFQLILYIGLICWSPLTSCTLAPYCAPPVQPEPDLLMEGKN